jgi:hypothetical protein
MLLREPGGGLTRKEETLTCLESRFRRSVLFRLRKATTLKRQARSSRAQGRVNRCPRPAWTVDDDRLSVGPQRCLLLGPERVVLGVCDDPGNSLAFGSTGRAVIPRPSK